MWPGKVMESCFHFPGMKSNFVKKKKKKTEVMKK